MSKKFQSLEVLLQKIPAFGYCGEKSSELRAARSRPPLKRCQLGNCPGGRAEERSAVAPVPASPADLCSARPLHTLRSLREVLHFISRSAPSTPRGWLANGWSWMVVGDGEGRGGKSEVGGRRSEVRGRGIGASAVHGCWWLFGVGKTLFSPLFPSVLCAVCERAFFSPRFLPRPADLCPPTHTLQYPNNNQPLPISH